MTENKLDIFLKGDKLYTDSREVAKMIGKRHDHLIRDIDGYFEVLSNNPKLGSSNFFVSSTYKHENRFKELSKTDEGKTKAQKFIEYTVKQPVFMKMYVNVQKMFDDLENWDNYDN